MNPQAPIQTTCIACNALLAHPASSLYIQCPKCFITMNTREAREKLAQTYREPQIISASSIPGAEGSYMHRDGLHGHYGIGERPPQKKKRDPNAPKAASNAYMIFCKEYRPKLKEDHPELPFGKLGARLGEIWRTLTPEQKKPYESRASMDRERYRKEMELYQRQRGAKGEYEEPIRPQ